MQAEIKLKKYFKIKTMLMKRYFLYNDRVEIILEDDRVFTVFLNQCSGRIYYRFKIGTLSDVKHPAIYLGVDIYGNNYYMHNHYQTEKPAIVIETEFTKGRPIYFYEETMNNNSTQIIQSGLDQVLSGEPYSWLNYNCQSFIHLAGNNQNKSEDVTKWFGRALVGLFIVVIAKSI
jgi:hypothetical protein